MTNNKDFSTIPTVKLTVTLGTFKKENGLKMIEAINASGSYLGLIADYGMTTFGQISVHIMTTQDGVTEIEILKAVIAILSDKL